MKQKTFLLLSSILILFTVACGNSTPTDAPQVQLVEPSPTTAEPNTPVVSPEDGYPSPLSSSELAYPAPTLEGVVPDLPSGPTDLPAPSESLGVVGGALVSPIEGQGYFPVEPQSITLGEIVMDDQGRPVFLRSSDTGQKATLYDAGVFIFPQVEPGEYGLVVDLGYGVFPVTSEDGSMLLFTVNPGEALDLGVVLFKLQVEEN